MVINEHDYLQNPPEDHEVDYGEVVYILPFLGTFCVVHFTISKSFSIFAFK